VKTAAKRGLAGTPATPAQTQQPPGCNRGAGHNQDERSEPHVQDARRSRPGTEDAVVERVAQDHITLARFPGYWNAASIHFDRVIYLTMPDSSVRLANLKSGTIDISEYIVPTDASAVQSDPKLRLIVSDALGYHGITNNLANGPQANTPYGKDPRVRNAFELSIDAGQEAGGGLVGRARSDADVGQPNAEPIYQATPCIVSQQQLADHLLRAVASLRSSHEIIVDHVRKRRPVRPRSVGPGSLAGRTRARVRTRAQGSSRHGDEEPGVNPNPALRCQHPRRHYPR